jgi:hypothetical protein
VFSETVIQRNIERFEAAESARLTAARGTTTRFRLIHFPPSMIEEMVEHLKTITDKQTGEFTRDLTSSEKFFVDNERAMRQLNFRHACENYYYIQLAGKASDDRPEGWSELDVATAGHKPEESGVIGKFIFNGMQEALHAKVAEIELREFEAYRRGATVNGINLITLKARALGASAYWQAAGYSRTQFFSNINGLTASMDDQSTQRMHRRYERIYENDVPWGRAPYKKWTQDRGIILFNGSTMELQDGMQKTDLGKSEAWHFWHVTEASMFPRPEDHFDEGLFPATPTGMFGGFPVICAMETTAKGKLGWFKDFWDQVFSNASSSETARSEAGAGRFDWFFAPFYLIDIHDEGRGQRSKYRMEPPPDWEPSQNTLLMAKTVLETSADYTPDHRRVELHRDVLFWYENTRRRYYKAGRLNVFLQSYPVTHNEAFQHTAAGAFSPETIERLDRDAAQWSPHPYRLMSSDEAQDFRINPYRFNSDDSGRLTPLPVYEQSGYFVGPVHESELDKDPRGFIWFWMLPDERPRNFIVSCDATGGIPNWQRAFREQSDINTDNGCVQVWLKEPAAASCETCKGVGWLATSSRGVDSECPDCSARGKTGGRAVQCAEYAAPIDAEDIALYVWLLGRLYKTTSDFEECLAILETNNTGILTIRALQNVYNYSNLYQSRAEGSAAPKFTGGYGFTSGPSTVPLLHARSKIRLVKRDTVPKSKWLIKELSDAIVKLHESGKERFWVPPGGGRHDDRMTTAFLAWIAMFDWYESDDGTPGELSAPARALPDYAARDVSAEDQNRLWNEAMDARVGGGDLSFEVHDERCEPNCPGCLAGADDPDADLDDDERLEYGFDEDDDDGFDRW